MKKYFEETLPEGYKLVKTVDAKDKKTSMTLNIVTSVTSVLLVAACFFIFRPVREESSLLKAVLFLVSIVVYYVLHELVHGLVYKIMTRRKLKFGMTLSVAFCGVPDIYVYRITALLSLVAPFIVFTVVFVLLTVFLPGNMNKFMTSSLCSIHLAGCSGDIYDTLLLLFRLRDKTTLMNDTGPKQTFYVKEK